MTVPAEAQPLLHALSPVFTRPTLHRFVTLFGSAILTTGRRTLANIRRAAAPLAQGHATSYQRVLSSAEWSALRLAGQLGHLVLALIPADQTVVLVGDDTVDGHPGRKVYGKARHRDPVRSSHGYTAWRYGHKWVVLAVLVRFPWANRPWALPVLVDLDRSQEEDQKRRRPHRTPAQIMSTLLRVMLWWFSQRRFVFGGDRGFGSHEMARFVHRHRARLSLVSKLHPEGNLFEPPPPYSGQGRPPVKGPRRPKPKEAVATATLQVETVAWYGGGQREVGVTTGTEHWSELGEGLVPLVWVFLKDQTGTHRDESCFSTELTMTAVAMIGAYCGRWNLEKDQSHSTQEGGGVAPVPPVTIGISALLELATWCERRLAEPPGVPSCPTPLDATLPPAPEAPATPIPTIWARLPTDRQQQLRDLLGQLLARLLSAPPGGEVGRD